MSFKNYVIFWGGGGEVIKWLHWITGGRGGVPKGPKMDYVILECSLTLSPMEQPKLMRNFKYSKTWMTFVCTVIHLKDWRNKLTSLFKCVARSIWSCHHPSFPCQTRNYRVLGRTKPNRQIWIVFGIFLCTGWSDLILVFCVETVSQRRFFWDTWTLFSCRWFFWPIIGRRKPKKANWGS